MIFARVGALRPASTLCALSAGALMASTTSIAFQDMAALLSDVRPAERWQSHMVAAPQGSVHAATYRPSRFAATGRSAFAPRACRKAVSSRSHRMKTLLARADRLSSSARERAICK